MSHQVKITCTVQYMPLLHYNWKIYPMGVILQPISNNEKNKNKDITFLFVGVTNVKENLDLKYGKACTDNWMVRSPCKGALNPRHTCTKCDPCHVNFVILNILAFELSTGHTCTLQKITLKQKNKLSKSFNWSRSTSRFPSLLLTAEIGSSHISAYQIWIQTLFRYTCFLLSCMHLF